MKNIIYLVKCIRKFGLNAVCNATSELYPLERESVYEYDRRLKMYREVGK